MDVLGSVRLSRLTDATTSPDRQRDIIREWADRQGGRLVRIAEDVDVSGAVSPFARVDLGPWLTDTPPERWDTLAAWKLDRLSRSARDTLDLLEWCQARGKRIVCVSDGIDTDTAMGRMWVQLAAIFAEMERTAIAERALASRARNRSAGRWHGERRPYGYRPIKLDGGGWRFEVDPDEAAVIRRVVADVLDGKSVNSIADTLTAEGVPTPRHAGRWHNATLFQILRSSTLRGYRQYQGRPVRDAEGRPITRADDPILDTETWRRLQTQLDARSRTPQRTHRSSLLSGLATCAACGHTLHHHRQRERGYDYRYYVCSGRKRHKCDAPKVNADALEAEAEQRFLAIRGDEEVTVPVPVPAESHTAELEDAVSAVDELTALVPTTRSRSARDRLLAQISTLDARIADLERLPSIPAHDEYVGTGETYADAWRAGNTADRCKLLTDAGVRLSARSKPWQVRVDVNVNRLATGPVTVAPVEGDVSEWWAGVGGTTDHRPEN